MARSTAPASWPTSNRSWCPRCSRATSSSPITSACTRSPASAAPSKTPGATLWYLPPYSPDLHPIELCFAKLKAIIRAARCRSIDTLWPLLGECLQRFSPTECRRPRAHGLARRGAELGPGAPRVFGRNRRHHQSAPARRSRRARRAGPRPHPGGRWQTSTFLAALRVTGLTAPGVLRWRESTAPASWPTSNRSWCPRCSRATSSSPITSACTRSPASAAPSKTPGATLWYLPPYSPDLHPIELCFAKLKAIVRAARCRSIDTLWPLLGECLQRFSPTECRNYFRHCGYSNATRL